jgi:hypothetical protein
MYQTKLIEKIFTYILCSIPFLIENHAVNEIMWKNIVQPGGPQMTIWRMRYACWIPKITNTHPECVILLILHYNSGYIYAYRCYVMCTLPVLFILMSYKHREVEDWCSAVRCHAVWLLEF